VSTISTPTALAPLAAGQVLFGPLRILVAVWHSIMQPELVLAIARNDRRAVVRALEMSMLAFGAVVLALGLTIVACWDVVFAHLYATKYAGAPMPGIVAVCLATTLCAVLATPASGVLQTLMQYRVLSLGTVYGSGISLSAAIALLLSLGPTWSLLGILAGEAFALFYNVTVVARILNRWRHDGYLRGVCRAGR
jgi:O-antigen/teichoic acid export membrane protein